MAKPYCRNCGTDLTPQDKFCSNCGQPRRSPSAKAVAPTTTQEVYVAPTAQEVYAQPVHEQPTVYEQPQFPQTVYDEARATGHPVYEQPQPAAQGQPTTQINQTFVTHQPQQVPMPMYSAGDRKNPGVAAILSFFYAGLGQIYNGQLLKGIGFMVVYALSIASILIVIGFILVPLVWVIGIYDAYHTAKSYNEKQIQNEMAYHASLARR